MRWGGERQRGQRQGANRDGLGNKIKYKQPNMISTNKKKAVKKQRGVLERSGGVWIRVMLL